MTVAELIEMLKQMPQHHPVTCDGEPIVDVRQGGTYNNLKSGPFVALLTADPLIRSQAP